MDPKSFLFSKVLWTNVVAVIAAVIAPKVGVTLDAETQVMILAGINAILRIVTKQPVTLA